MADQEQISQIYDLQIKGSETVLSKLDSINNKFADVRKTVRDLKKDMELKIAEGADASKVDALKQRIKELEVVMKGLSLQRKQEEAAAKATQQALLNEAKIREANAKAARAEEAARKQKLAADAAEERQATRTKTQMEALAGSYNDVQKKYSELLAIAKNSVNVFNPEEVRQAQQELLRYKTILDSFQRGLTKDGTLVGEYTTGILQAFRQSGLDDVISNQINNAKNQVKQLDDQFEKLKQELSDIRVTGQGSFDAIERQMIENRNEAQQLNAQIAQVNARIRSLNGVGKDITESIADGFKSLKGSISSFVFQYIGFQALFSKLTTEVSAGIEQARQIEGVEIAFKRLNDPSLLSNLRAATKGTVTDLNLMKAAVQAENFQIPLENLAGYFEFAKQRALDTGQSVDYLVDSIILGIGRKSPLILDNLGISAVRLKDEFKGLSVESANVGDVAAAVGRIIAEENAKVAGSTSGVSVELAKNQAQWENLRTRLAQNALPILAAVGSVALGVASALGAIPFPVLVAGFTALTTAVAIYKAEQIRAYIVTQLATKEGLVYNSYLLLQAARTRLVALATKAATWEIILFNGAIKISPLGWFFTILGVVVPLVAAFAGNTKEAAKQQNALNDVTRRAGEIYAGQISAIDQWVATIRSAETSAKAKKTAIDELIAIDPQFRTALQGQIINLNKLAEAYKTVTDGIKLKAEAEAASQISAEKYKNVLEVTTLRTVIEREFAAGKGGSRTINGLSRSEIDLIMRNTDMQTSTVRENGSGGISFASYDFKTLVDAIRKEEDARLKTYQDYIRIKNQKDAELQKLIASQNKTSAATYEVDIAALKKSIEDLDKSISEFRGSKVDLEKLIKQREAAQNQMDALMNKKATGSASTVANLRRDALAEIDAATNQQLADLERKHLEGVVSEENYWREVNRINKEGIDKKLAKINDSSGQEKELISKLKLERIKQDQELNDQLFRIGEQAAKERLEAAKREAENQAKVITENPNATDEQRVQAQVTADTRILAAYQRFAADMGKLETDLNRKSKDNAQDRAQAIVEADRRLLADREELNKAIVQRLTDTNDKTRERLQASENTDYNSQLAVIYNSRYGTEEKRKRDLEDLEREHQQRLLSIEQAAVLSRIQLIESLHRAGLLSTEAYNAAVIQLNQRRAETEAQIAKSTLEEQRKTWNRTKDFLAEFAKGAQGLYSSIFQPLFNLQRQRIDNEEKATQTQIDEEEKRRLASAQSEEERAAIQAQFDRRREEAEKAAGEKRKQVALKILAIESAIAAIKAISTAATIYEGLAYAALVGIQYLIQRQQIEEQEFAEGGMLQRVLSGGGIFQGPSHANGGIPFAFGGRAVNVEGNEGYVINKQSMASGQRVSVAGTPAQIASAANVLGGGVNFAPGATIRRFEYSGGLGASVRPPVFASSLQRSSGDDITEIKEMVLANTQAIMALSQIPVQLNPNLVTKYQVVNQKAVTLGTI